MSSSESETIDVSVFRKRVSKRLRIKNISDLKPGEKIFFDIAFDNNVYVLNVGTLSNVNAPYIYLSVDHREDNVKRNVEFDLSLQDNNGRLFLRKRDLIKPNSPLMISTNYTLRDLPSRYLIIHYELSGLSWTEEEASPKKKTTPFFRVENLSLDFGRLYSQGTNADVVIKVGKGKIPVHSQILSARSVVFAAMFEHDMAEKLNKTVEISDISAMAMHHFLTFVYSGKLEVTEDLRQDTLMQLYIAADKYAVMELKEMISDFMLSNISLDSVASCAELAFTRFDQRMQEAVIKFVSRNTLVLDSRQWRELEDTAPSVAAEVLNIALAIRSST